MEVRSSYQDTKPWELVVATLVPAFRRITLRRYVEDKVQCIVERAEARDLIDLRATLTLRPELESFIKQAVAEQDALLRNGCCPGMTQPFAEISRHTRTSNPETSDMRKLLLSWLKEGSG